MSFKLPVWSLSQNHWTCPWCLWSRRQTEHNERENTTSRMRSPVTHTHTKKKTLDCHTTQKQVKYIFNYFKKKSSILKDLQSKSFLRRLPLARHTYTVNGRPWYTIKFTAQLTLRRTFRPDSLRESQKGFNKRHTHSWKHQNLWI